MKVTKQLIQDDPVKAAVAMAKTPRVNPEAARAQLMKKRRELENMEDLSKDFLPIEHTGTSDVAEKIQSLKNDITALLSQTVPHPTILPVFDLECLRWRDENGFPRLVPFSVNHPEVTFGIKKMRWGRRFSWYTEPALKYGLAGYYKDVSSKLRSLRRPGHSIVISASFDGVIPDHVRDTIMGAKEIYEDLRIVAEVRGWKVTEKRDPVRSVAADPILIGYYRGLYRMVEVFDTTSVEQIAADRSKGRKSS